MISRTLLPGLFLLVLLAKAACAEDHALQALVTSPSGKPFTGVEVRLERMDAKAAVQTSKTDSKGQADFKNVAAGKYKLTALNNGTPAAAIVVDAGLNQTTTATLSLKANAQAPTAVPLKKRKHYVWVAGETGTHIGGGRWVAVEDNTSGTGANPVDKRNPQMVNQPQSFQMRPFQGPSH